MDGVLGAPRAGPIVGPCRGKPNYRISNVVIATLNACAAAAHANGAEISAAPPDIAEVVVTAQRRVESAQDVPITLQVLTADTIKQLDVTTFDDFVKYLPNVTTLGSGPGQSEIYMRGLGVGFAGTQGSGAVYSFPNVAVYLDEQPGQLPYRNLDIYAADLQRIEILEGPQGTLFGAGAEAGVIRYITNKPKLDVTEGNINAGYATTSGGKPSANFDAAINIPLIEDELAIRAVLYDESRGGYIDNIPATFSRSNVDKVVVNYFGGIVPPNSGPINNYPEAGNAINPVVYKGLRVSGLWKISNDWNALLMQAYQDLDSDGVFWEEAYDGLGKPLPPLSVALFNPNYNNDQFEDTQLTINGRLGALQLVYSGGYLDRSSDQQQDYTNYSRGRYAGYYQCNYPGYPFNRGFYTAANAPNPSLVGVAIPTPGSFTQSNAYPGMGVTPGYCWSPSATYQDRERSTHQNHELRLATPDDWRLRGLVGLFWEDYSIHEQTDYYYGTSPNFQPVAPPPTATSNNPSVRPFGDSFFTDVTRGYTQTAAFGSVDFDLIPNVLTLTGGTRRYDMRNFESGSNIGSFGCEIYGPSDGNVPPNPCGLPESNGVNLNSENLGKTYTGFKSRANLTWHVTPDDLLYYTWSQGFRPGGFNRAAAVIAPTSPLYGIFEPPLVYGPDTLVNNEFGWKTEWLGHRLQWNGALYQEDWKNVQISILDPGITGDLTFLTNGPDYRVRGFETSFVARVGEGLTVTASASCNSSEVVQTVSLVNPHTGQPINIVNPFGTLGTPLANSPPFEGNIRARYVFPINEYHAFWQLAATHQGGSYSTTDHLSTTLQGVSIVFYQPGFNTYNASAGIEKGAWTAQLYGDNLADTRGILGSFYGEWVKADTIIRPRTVGIRVSYGFKENK